MDKKKTLNVIYIGHTILFWFILYLFRISFLLLASLKFLNTRVPKDLSYLNFYRTRWLKKKKKKKTKNMINWKTKVPVEALYKNNFFAGCSLPDEAIVDEGEWAVSSRRYSCPGRRWAMENGSEVRGLTDGTVEHPCSAATDTASFISWKDISQLSNVS